MSKPTSHVTREKVKILLEKYVEGNCTPSEEKLIKAWLDHQLEQENWSWENDEHALETGDKIKKILEEHIQHARKPRFFPKRKWSIGAAFIILLGGVLLLINRTDDQDYQHLAVSKDLEEAVEPGSVSATLTTGDGSIINLADLENSILSQSDQVDIKIDDGQLLYQGKGKHQIGKVDSNLVSIPVGGTYRITLPDGTKVWLNAASTLKYPVVFVGDSRRVELEGEAYFEVVTNKEQPFIVQARDTETRATGTSFNITAYKEDTGVATTLLDGEVFVSKNEEELRLVPGEQSISLEDNVLSKIKADVEAIVGWKNGYFIFDDQDIETVLRNIARWYDVEIYIHKNQKHSKKIGGTFSRKRDLIELLQYLEKLNVLTFEKDGRRVNVMI